MQKVLILVEGQTEETFVRDLLAPHLNGFDVYAIPKIAVTKRVKSGGHFKGGIVAYSKIQTDIRLLVNDSSAARVTTMIDYYGLPEDFPGMKTRPAADCYIRARHIEEAFKQDINHPRFVPYLSLHEFEAFLYVSPQMCADYLPVEVQAKLTSIAEQVGSPEEINEGSATSPSKRLLAMFPGYEKPLYGTICTLAIGLPALREKCSRFSKWLADLESLAQS